MMRSLATGCSTNTIKMFAIKSNQSSIGTLRRRSVNYTQISSATGVLLSQTEFDRRTH